MLPQKDKRVQSERKGWDMGHQEDNTGRIWPRSLKNSSQIDCGEIQKCAENSQKVHTGFFVCFLFFVFGVILCSCALTL